ncbi:CarD family transcriptional regulator [Agathobaculum desmolans]|uniref:CarD family transcriptional regulator n=1 Tax=Agathobaculum desmolans TaxID=39484 RepID=UPI00248DBFC8|nr:CarD family transcriptional regulator [Agathobaculum desmolans]
MYQAGEFIVYGTSGVCRVEGVGTPPFAAEEERLYYKLTPVSGTETIYIPTDSPVFTRPVITRAQAENLIASIPSIEEDSFTSHSARLSSEHYQAALQSHDCRDLVQLIKTVYARSKRGGRRVSQIDQRYRKRAEDLLHGELAVALGIPVSEVPPYIARVIGQKKTS